jgi:hypothetical protein
LPVRLLVGFGRFWWDFLVGDTPELAIATLVVLAVAATTSEVLHLNALAVVVLPLLVVLALVVSVGRAVRSQGR